MGAGASLGQIPELLISDEGPVGISSLSKHNLSILHNSPNREVLAGVRRRSYSENKRKLSLSGGLNSSRRSSKSNLKVIHDIPAAVNVLLERIGLGENYETKKVVGIASSGGGGNERTTMLVSHIFECLGALQHLVRANKDALPNIETDETQSVLELNKRSVGKLLHEMVTIYGLCGDTMRILLDAEPGAATVEVKPTPLQRFISLLIYLELCF